MKYKELIANFTENDYLNHRVNLHIHSTYSDGEILFTDVVSELKNYKALSVTDHNTIKGYRENPSNLIPGVEFDVWHGYIFLHLLAYGIDINNAEMEKFYAKTKKGTRTDIVRFFSNRNLKELIKAIHNAGGIAVLAHPACCWAINPKNFIKELVDMGLDGIEIYYPYPRWRKYLKFSSPSEYKKLADVFGLIKTGGTDCHCKYLK